MTLIGLFSLALLQFPLAAFLLLLVFALAGIGGQSAYILGVLLGVPILAVFLLPSVIFPLLPRSFGAQQLSQVLGILAVAGLLGSGLFRELVGQVLVVQPGAGLMAGMLIVAAAGVSLAAAAMAGALVASIVLLATLPMQWLAGELRNAPAVGGWFFAVARLWILGILVYGASTLLLEFIVSWTKPALVIAAT